MTAILVKDGEMVCDSMTIHTPIAFSWGEAFDGVKFYHVGGNRAVITRCGDLIDSQLKAEKIFLMAAPYLIKARRAAISSINPHQYVAEVDLDIDDKANELLKGCGTLRNVVIMTRDLVLAIDRGNRSAYTLVVHSNRHPSRAIYLGSDTNHLKLLSVMGFSPREIVERSVKWSGYVGGEIHHFKSQDLTVMPLTEDTMIKVGSKCILEAKGVKP